MITWPDSILDMDMLTSNHKAVDELYIHYHWFI